MNALNPNHEVTQHAQSNWQALMATLLCQIGESATLTIADIERLNMRFPGDQPVVMVHYHADTIELRLVSRTEGERLAREHGGLPQ
ncbi:hypothetical protein B0G81_6789 [Paraburkholderia sp. BL6665CI2N2]|uniref:hypothetical protein n=1 Tax=Paraburkholderia sp. BL6665CI2N2 TaxID=1938806 RepID=UPI0010662B4C|nr:hypothetical protein [Paraburkholderia sp. BL6665CI2N2]TDY26279.1 hypothetical protein B0G81_6789 [Paraburkholderia sp. BL6665CI2N2]